MNVLILIFFIICCILLIISINKKREFTEIDNKTIEENEKLQRDKELLEQTILALNESKDSKQKDLDRVNEIINNMNAAARAAFSEFQESLDAEYQKAEKEHDDAIDTLRHSYDELQEILINRTKKERAELDKISATRAAAQEAQLKEQAIKDKLSFYCPQVSDEDLNDAKILKDIEYKLNNPRVLRMLI